MVMNKAISRSFGVGCWRSLHSSSRLRQHQKTSSSSSEEQYLDEYKIRSLLEVPIEYYSTKKIPKLSIHALFKQSETLSSANIKDNAMVCLERLLIFTAVSLKKFRNLPYLVVLNPAISESYNMYLKSMSLLLTATANLPTNLQENKEFTDRFINQFLELHIDSLPSLSKGFNEVSHLLPESKVKLFLNHHLEERIIMRLVAHQHSQLSETLCNPAKFVPGSKYNGTVQPLDITSIVKKNADMVNHIFFLKYDQTVPITIECDSDVVFPYVEYHLDYILSELFKNSFRSHVENHIRKPVHITIVNTGETLQMRIRDYGLGIPDTVMKHIFDYSFTTFDDEEGDSYKTLNAPPGEAANVVAGMGYGLPLLQNYVQCFNSTTTTQDKGLLSLQTYPGLGTDIYLKLSI
jgi:signal transduction histidine kinase